MSRLSSRPRGHAVLAAGLAATMTFAWRLYILAGAAGSPGRRNRDEYEEEN